MKQYATCIFIDGEAPSPLGNGQVFTPDKTQAQHYETQVASILDIIHASICGQVVMREVRRGGLGKNVRIIPTPVKDARAVPADAQAATPYNQPLRFPGDLPNTPHVEKAGQIRTNPAGAPMLGTGDGSNVTITYQPLTWLIDTLQTGRVGNLLPDDVLVHELLHALRMMNGKIQTLDLGNADHTARFGNTEEFYAVMVANIYISERNAREKRGQPLRGNVSAPDKFKPLSAEESQSKTFYQRFKPSIQSLCNEMIGLTHGGGMTGLMHVPAPFNPIRDCEQESEELRMRYYGGMGLPDFPPSR